MAVFSLLSADDLHWFNQGSHQRLYRKLGAHVIAAGTEGALGRATTGGVYFAVWAPDAEAVSVVGDWNQWSGGVDTLVPRDGSGIWEGFIDGITIGSRYKFRIVSRSGEQLDKADPFGRRCETPPATASVVWNSRYAWSDDKWLTHRGALQALDQPMSIYEAHLGSWKRPGGVPMTYREFGVAMAEYATRLGFTHVELMPVMEHPFYGSWGYQVTGFFAPTSRYGNPDDFKAMVDTLHQAGLGVILDWVPAHFPTDAHGLGRFDGSALFEHADPRRGFHPDWTSFIFNYSRHEVRSFLISSALFWFDEFHIDGMRVDGVASMLYRDYSRKPGEWIPGNDGGNQDNDAVSLLQDVNRAVYAAYPDVQTIAEESTAWAGVSRPTETGGLGFGYKWDLGWMHDTLSYLSRDAIYRRHHHDELTFRNIYADSENFILPLSHDEVVHGKGSLLGKMPGDPWQRRATLRALFGYQWTTPGKKLLFMGGEFGVWGEWNHDQELDWPLLDHPDHAGIARWVGDLNHQYRTLPALHQRDAGGGGFEWIIGDDRDASMLVYIRRGNANIPLTCVVLNFTPIPRMEYRLGVPLPGYWREVLNSDAGIYGGGNLGNLGGVEAEPIASNGHAWSIQIVAPPLACVVFVHEPIVIEAPVRAARGSTAP